MAIKREAGRYTNVDTGEFFIAENPMYEDEGGGVFLDNDSIKRRVVHKKEMKRRSLITYEYGNFVFARIRNNMIELHKMELNDSQIAKVFLLSTFSDDDGVLYNKGFRMTRKDIMEQLSINASTFTRDFKSFKENNIINEHEGRYYRLSKEYFIRGPIFDHQKGDIYIKIFINTMREIYDSIVNKKRSGYRAFLMAVTMMPFIQYNDISVKYENGNFVTVNDILKIMGISDNNSWRQINYIRDLKLKNGEYFIKFITTGFDRESALKAGMVINPKIFYKGDAQYMMELCKYFEEMDEYTHVDDFNPFQFKYLKI